MSDPVSNVEIEDVLSSIRRLVSEEKRPAPRAASATQPSQDPASSPASASPAAPAPADKLVLTPALRVADEDNQAWTESLAEDRRDGSAGNAEPGEDSAQSRPDTPPEDAARDSAEEEPDKLEDRIAELEAAVADRDDHWDPDGISDDDYAGSPVEALPWEDADVDPGADDETDAENSGTGAEEAREAEDEAREVAADEDGDAGLSAQDDMDDAQVSEDAETAGTDPDEGFDASEFRDETDDYDDEEARAQNQWDADAGSEDTGAADDHDDAQIEIEGQAIDDTGEDDAPPQRQAAPEADDDEARTDFMDDGDAILDEESLREMVADIVRQELQGALGERITRNVRKLVRREIHRALTSQELE